MKRILLFLTLFAQSRVIHAQRLDSLFERGKNREIVQTYEAATRAFDNEGLGLVAAVYDRLGRLDEEEKVLYQLVSSYPLLLTYAIPSAFSYYGHFIKAGRMEWYGNWLGRQYQQSVKDTALGIDILNAFYRDQGIREQYLANELCRKNGWQPEWDSSRLMHAWARIDSANAVWIAGVIRDHRGFPSKADIGLIGTSSLFILMQHLDLKYRDRYDRILFDAACRHDITMTDYAMYRTMTLVRSHQIPDSLFQHCLDSLLEIKCR